MQPVIIEAALNGFTLRAENPHVPVKPEEVSACALACLAAGASSLHTHIDIPHADAEVAADRYLQAWLPVWSERPDALFFPAMHFPVAGGHDLSHVRYLTARGRLRICPVDPGSIMWASGEHDGVPVGDDVFVNSYADIAEHMAVCERHRLGPNLAVWEPGMLQTVLAWWRAGKLPRGAMIKFYFCGTAGLNGVRFGLPPTGAALTAYLEVLGDCTLPWAASLVGGDLLDSEVAGLAIAAGGHLNLGLEFYRGFPTSNEELIVRAVDLCRSAGRPVATPVQAEEILDLWPTSSGF